MAHVHPHSHSRREFGVSPSELAPGFEARGDEQTATLPAPEIYNLERQEALERLAADAQQALEDTPHQIDWDGKISLGAVVRPNHNTLRAYKWVLKLGGGAHDIAFSPLEYPLFDGVIARRSRVDDTGKSISPAFNPEHPDYLEYAPLRRNLAILRNYLLVTLFPEGANQAPQDGEARRRYEQAQQMAVRLGDALAGGTQNPSLWARWFGTAGRALSGRKLSEANVSPFMRLANVPDRGIDVMYQYLFGLKSNPPFWRWPPFGASPGSWPLLSPEQTPFSHDNLLLYGRARDITTIANVLDGVVQLLREPEKIADRLTERDRRVSVEYARTILEKLRISLNGGDHRAEYADPTRETARDLLRGALAFRGLIAQLVDLDPDAVTNPFLANAFSAIEQISYRVKNEAQIMLHEEGEGDAEAAMAKRRAATPSWIKTKTPPDTMDDLIKALQGGLAEGSRLVQISLARSQNLQRTQQRQAGDPSKFASGQVSQASDPAKVDAIRRQALDAASQGRGPKVGN